MLTSILATAIILAPIPAEESPPLIDIDWTVVIQFALFLLLYAVLSRFLFRPFLKMRDQRDASIAGARKDATAMQQKSAAMMADYEAQFARAQQRGADQRATMRKGAAAYEHEVLAAAKEESSKATEQAKMRLQIQTQQARTKLNDEATGLAKLVARRILGREAV